MPCARPMGVAGARPVPERRGCHTPHRVPSSLCWCDTDANPLRLGVSLLWMRHAEVPVGHELEVQAVLGRALGLNSVKVWSGQFKHLSIDLDLFHIVFVGLAVESSVYLAHGAGADAAVNKFSAHAIHDEMKMCGSRTVTVASGYTEWGRRVDLA